MVKQYNLKFQEHNNQNYFKLSHAIENQWMRLKVKKFTFNINSCIKKKKPFYALNMLRCAHVAKVRHVLAFQRDQCIRALDSS